MNGTIDFHQGNQLGDNFWAEIKISSPRQSSERVRQLVGAFADEWDLGLNAYFEWQLLEDVDAEMKGLSKIAIDDIARCRHEVKSDVLERPRMLSLLKAMVAGERTDLFQPIS